MKYLILLAALLFTFNVLAEDKEPVWADVTPPGSTLPYTVYKNIIEDSIDQPGDKEHYARGQILFVGKDKLTRPGPNNTQFQFKSVVLFYVIECNSALVVPALEMYYDISFPKLLSKPKATLAYRPDAYYTISKKNPMYNIMCPVTI